MRLLRKLLHFCFLGLIIITVSGCLTIGRDFKAKNVFSIKKGETTKFDLVEMFGAPFRKGYDNGQETWTYVLNKYNVVSGVKSKDLYIIFDNQGRVSSYVFNTNFKGELE